MSLCAVDTFQVDLTYESRNDFDPEILENQREDVQVACDTEDLGGTLERHTCTLVGNVFDYFTGIDGNVDLFEITNINGQTLLPASELCANLEDIGSEALDCQCTNDCSDRYLIRNFFGSAAAFRSGLLYCDLLLFSEDVFNIFVQEEVEPEEEEEVNEDDINGDENNNGALFIILAGIGIALGLVAVIFVLVRRQRKKRDSSINRQDELSSLAQSNLNELQEIENPKFLKSPTPKSYLAETSTLGTAVPSSIENMSIINQDPQNESNGRSSKASTYVSSSILESTHKHLTLTKLNLKHLSTNSNISLYSIVSFKSEISENEKNNFKKVKKLSRNNLTLFKHLNKRCTLDIKASAKTLTSLVEQIAQKIEFNFFERGRKERSEGKEYEIFSCKEVPGIDLGEYLNRLVIGLNLWYYDEEETNEIGIRSLMITIIYLNKIEEKVEVTKYNIHRLLACLMLISSKFCEDDVITNSYWGEVCGIDLEDINLLEKKLCFNLNFDFYVKESDLSLTFEKYGVKLKK